MRIVHYPHPTLRHKSRPIKKIDRRLHAMIDQMFECMYGDNGIGLAANQVDLPYRMFVMNVEADPAIKDEEYVFINPVITKREGMAERDEGCLSLPDIFAPVRRPETIEVTSFDRRGQEVTQRFSGLHARAVQHEIDHLDGVLFIDRLSESNRMAVKAALENLQRQFDGDRARGLVPMDNEIADRLAVLEGERT